MKISIVVPCYNAELYLEETLQSLFSQDYKDLEIIAVNDGSTDSTPLILEKFKDRMTVIHQENLGQSLALNNGWRASSGDVLGYLSSDDLLQPQALSQLAQAFGADPQVDIVYPDYNLIDDRSVVIKKVEAPSFDLQGLVLKMICSPGPGALFRREVFQTLGGWRPMFRQTPDFDFWLRACRIYKFKREAACLASFRIHDDSQTYMKPGFEKSEEPIHLMKNFIKNGFHPTLQGNENIALSTAYLLAGRLHARAWRVGRLSRCLLKAARLNPRVLVSPETSRLIMAGLFGRWKHQWVLFKNRNLSSQRTR